MRLDAWILGMAACLIAGSAEAKNDNNINEGLERRTTNEVIQFQDLTFPPLFNSTNVVIQWKLGGSYVNITSASLKGQDNSTLLTGYFINGNNGQSSAGPNGKRKNDDRSSGVFAPPIRLTARNGLQFPVNASPTSSGSATIEFESKRSGYLNILDELVYLELEWSNGMSGSSSRSSTHLFAFTTSADSYNNLRSTLNSLYPEGIETPYFTEGPVPSTSTQTNTQPTPAGGDSSSIVATTGGPSTSPSTQTAGTAALGSEGSTAGPNGLSTGAIAGIAVGCGVVGIAAIIGGIWFLCFRRRRNAHTALGQNTGGYASDGAAAMIADKELPHVSADSPRSTYASDRGQLSRDVPVDASTEQRSSMVAAAATHEDTPYAPYSDRAPTSTGTRSQTDLAGATGTRSPTPPISTRYAHLVEEGMSEDEIRRLDEEERQLDAAIEVAGRNSRAA